MCDDVTIESEFDLMFRNPELHLFLKNRSGPSKISAQVTLVQQLTTKRSHRVYPTIDHVEHDACLLFVNSAAFGRKLLPDRPVAVLV